MAPKEEYSYLSSRLVKEVFFLGGQSVHLLTLFVDALAQRGQQRLPAFQGGIETSEFAVAVFRQFLEPCLLGSDLRSQRLELANFLDDRLDIARAVVV